MKKYEYKHIVVPFSDEELTFIGVPLPPTQRKALDIVLEKTLNEAGAEGWRVVPPLVLPVALLEREIIEEAEG